MPTSRTFSPIQEGWVGSPFAGVLPPALYRYRQLSDAWIEKRLDGEVLGEEVFLAGADTLNDPDEGRVRWRVQGSLEEAFQVVLRVLRAQNSNANPSELIAQASGIAMEMVRSRSIPNETANQMHMVLGKLLRIACFTTQPLNGPMWTHYGNFSDGNGGITHHGGVCIEYAVDESWRQAGLRPVEYVEERPEINMLARDSLEAQFEYATCVKSPNWAYEDEWRLVAYLDAKPPWPANLTANSKLKLQGAVQSVILGLNAKGVAAEKVIDTLQKKAPHLAIKRVIRDESTEELTLAPL